MNTAKTCTSGGRLQPHISNDVFKCDYCLEKGTGLRFSCVKCKHKYNLHKECALAEAVRTHTFIRGVVFTLSKQKDIKVCAACGNPVQGFGYYCDSADKCLHPCCVYLPRKIESDEGDLYLDDKMFSDCEVCDRNDPLWCYRTKDKNNCVHISCMKEDMLNCLENQSFFNAIKDGLEEEANDEAKRLKKWKTEWVRASEDVKLLRDSSFRAQSFHKAESSQNIKKNRIKNLKTKKNRGFWRWVAYAVTYVAASVAASVGISFGPGPLRLEG